ncbi:hypothetical protein ES708_18590 [subsurface metagenome]
MESATWIRPYLGDPLDLGAKPDKKIMVYLQSYFDESGAVSNTKYLTFCGLIGTNSDWEVCHRKWNGALSDLGIKYFKANKMFQYATALSKQCPALGVNERIEALKPLLACIRDAIPLSASIVLFCEDYYRLSEKERRLIGDDPTYCAFLQALVLIKIKLGEMSSDDLRVSIICDDHHKYAPQFLAAYHHARQAMPELRETFVSIGFADDEFFPQLQMADFLSSIVRQEGAYRHDGAAYELRALYEYFFEDHNSVHRAVSAYIDEPLLKGLVQSRKSQGAERRKIKEGK